MDPKPISFLKKLNDFVFIAVILLLMIFQALLRKFVELNTDNSIWLDLVFNLVLGLCLFAFYLKKYNPDWIRKLFMAFFLLELIAGISMRKFHINYSSEIVVIGFTGILFTWMNTHMNRKKFVEEN